MSGQGAPQALSQCRGVGGRPGSLPFGSADPSPADAVLGTWAEMGAAAAGDLQPPGRRLPDCRRSWFVTGCDPTPMRNAKCAAKMRIAASRVQTERRLTRLRDDLMDGSNLDRELVSTGDRRPKSEPRLADLHARAVELARSGQATTRGPAGARTARERYQEFLQTA